MAQHTYAYQSWKPETMARAVGRDLSISTKDSVEICLQLHKKSLANAKSMLTDAIAMRKAIPLRRFNKKVPHRKVIGPGRYLCSAARAILRVIENLEANAQQKGLSTADLMVVHACAHKASWPFRASRHRGRQMKRTHVEIVCEEKAAKKPEGRADRTAKVTQEEKAPAVERAKKPQGTSSTSEMQSQKQAKAHDHNQYSQPSPVKEAVQ